MTNEADKDQLHTVIRELQRLPNPFRTGVVKGPFDRRQLPLCHELMDPVREQVDRAIAQHRTNPDGGRAMEPLSAPMVLITGETGAGKSRLLATLTQDMHGEEKTRLMVPVLPNDFLASDRAQRPAEFLAKRAEAFLFDPRVPGFPGARPIDLFALRIAKSICDAALIGTSKLPKSFPDDFKDTIRHRHPVNLRDLRHKSPRIGPALEYLVKEAGDQPFGSMRVRLLEAAAGLHDDEDGNPPAILTAPGVDCFQRLADVVAISNWLHCPITFLFDQFESLAIGFRDPYSPETMRAFMQRLLAELEPFEAADRPEFVPLCLLSLVPDDLGDLYDPNTVHRIPTLPNGQKRIRIDDYGFRPSSREHCELVARAYLDHMRTHDFKRLASDESRDHWPQDDPLWPFTTAGFEVMVERRGQIRNIRDWVIRCSDHWNRLIGQWHEGTDFDKHRHNWLAQVEYEFPSNEVIAPEDIAAFEAFADSTDAFNAPTRIFESDDLQPAPRYHTGFPTGSDTAVDLPTMVDQAQAAATGVSRPETVREFVTMLLDSLMFQERVVSEVADLSVAEREKKIEQFFLDLGRVGVAGPTTSHGAAEFVRVDGLGLLVAVSDADRRNKHERLFAERLGDVYSSLAEDEQDEIETFLFLSIGSDRFDTLPARMDEKPVVRYQLTAPDWYRILALHRLFESREFDVAKVDDDALRLDVTDTILRHWSLWLQLRDASE